MNARKWIAHFFLLACTGVCSAGVYEMYLGAFRWSGTFENGLWPWFNDTGGPIVVMATLVLAACLCERRYFFPIWFHARRRRGLIGPETADSLLEQQRPSRLSKTFLVLALLVSALSLAFVVDGWRRTGYKEERMARDILVFLVAIVGGVFHTILLPYAKDGR
ncbi:MAG: hypothetical protein GY851_06560 [bacterium]|nr:hypothetical protein [bacterium]